MEKVKAITPDVNYFILNPLQKEQLLAMLELPDLPHLLFSPHLIHYNVSLMYNICILVYQIFKKLTLEMRFKLSTWIAAAAG